MSKYNGYTNYETWNVCLWISNDEGLYNIATDCASYAEFVETMRELNCVETADNVSWNDSGINLDEVGEFWDESFSEVEA
jgi:hypothetical protein